MSTTTTLMQPVKTPRGWAVSGRMPHYLHECRTKRAAQEWIDDAMRRRQDLADEHGAILSLRGLEPVTYHELREGDEYTPTPDGRLRTITRIDRLANRTAMIYDGAPAAGGTSTRPGIVFGPTRPDVFRAIRSTAPEFKPVRFSELSDPALEALRAWHAESAALCRAVQDRRRATTTIQAGGRHVA